MKMHQKVGLIILLGILFINPACQNDSGNTGGNDGKITFDNAASPGQQVTVKDGSLIYTMIYVNNMPGITFPFSPEINTPANNEKATLTRKFFMSETEVTNALFVKVLQWAYNNGKFSTNTKDHNALSDVYGAKYGGNIITDLGVISRIKYSDGIFTIDTGYENHPVVKVTWYGAVIFCNWLTEMRDGNAANVVYTGIDETWAAAETIENADKTGYRLPSNEEWEFAARYVGTIVPVAENLASEYIAQNVRNGNADLTAGYYWAPATYASGAIKDYSDTIETRRVAWYREDPGMGGSNQLMPVSQKDANQLGIHDMSGSVIEWCFTSYVTGENSYRVQRGGCWGGYGSNMRMSYWTTGNPIGRDGDIGFRIVKTQ